MLVMQRIEQKEDFCQTYKIYLLLVGKKIQLRVAVSTVRTVEKKGGLDEYLLKTSNTKLPTEALKIKKLILSKIN